MLLVVSLGRLEGKKLFVEWVPIWMVFKSCLFFHFKALNLLRVVNCRESTSHVVQLCDCVKAWNNVGAHTIDSVYGVEVFIANFLNRRAFEALKQILTRGGDSGSILCVLWNARVRVVRGWLSLRAWEFSVRRKIDRTLRLLLRTRGHGRAFKFLSVSDKSLLILCVLGKALSVFSFH